MSSNANGHELTGQHDIRHPEVAFESRDLSARAVVVFLVVLAVAGVVTLVSVWGVYKYLAKEDLAPQPTTNPLMTSNSQLRQVGGDPAVTFPMPRLQPDPTADLNKFRVREDEILNTYGWVDQGAGRVRIPIEQAMELVSKTGLPAPPPAGAAGAAGGINVKPGAEKLPPPAQP